jgi:AraC family transcriptional regulator
LNHRNVSRTPRAHVPVTTGSAEFRTFDTRSSIVTDARFPPESVIEPHTHDRPIFGVMVSGGFQSAIANRRLDCEPTSLWTEPAGDVHANYIGREGARVMIVQPDPALTELLLPFAPLLEIVNFGRDPVIAGDARRIAGEIDEADELTPLAIDALVIGMFTTAMRRMVVRRGPAAPPRWLSRTRDLLHDEFRERHSLATLASLAGVHPSHLAREFRVHYGASVGEYIRRVRCDWAAARLLTTNDSISEIAASAGYSDQSHFTRQCVRFLGVGPARYRRTRGDGVVARGRRDSVIPREHSNGVIPREPSDRGI